VKVPSNVNIPVFVKEEFSDFYKSMFQTSYTRENQKVAFLEYAWDMSTCDPCAAPNLSNEELKEAGVFWLDNDYSDFVPPASRVRRPSRSNVFITRLHVRYTRDKFPEDLVFQETSNQESFQGRYVLQHPFKGEMKCAAGKQYQRSLRPRFEKEAQTLANLTNWKIQDIRKKMELTTGSFKTSWWDDIFSWFGIS
ncbi:MAG TPA: DUF2330 domain-containing protein, partial [Nostocaceae cyanobacterium]|nr:DUF2330 domain-containing protein [Nostocaceae cyanobacterium]